MKRLASIFLVTLGSLFAVYAQMRLPEINQWVFLYGWIFFSSMLLGMIEGIAATILTLSLAGIFLIPGLSVEDVLMLLGLMFLGICTSFSVENNRKAKLRDQDKAELEKAKGFLNALLDNIPLMVYVKDVHELRFLNFNEYGLRLLNLQRKDVLGRNDFDFCSNDNAERVRKTDMDALERGIVIDIPCEEVHVPGGGKLLFHTRKIPIKDESGKPLYLLGVSEDITEKVARQKKQALELQEEAARRERLRIGERERLLAQTIASLSEIMDYEETALGIVKSMVPSVGDWAVLSLVNEEGAFLRTAGIHRDPALQEYLDEFIQNFPPTEEDLEIQRALTKGEATLERALAEEDLMKLNRSPRKVELYKILGTHSSVIVPLRSRGGILGVLGMSRGQNRENFDELDLDHAQELGRRAGTILDNARLLTSSQKAVRSRDEFLTIASHELKTPITSLRLQLEMLLKPGRFPELSRPLQNAVKQVDRLTLLVNDLLDVGRLESGKMNYHLDVVGLGDLLKEVSTTMLPQFVSTGTVLLTEIEGNPLSFVDRYRMEQVIVNLLNNALKYGPGKPVQLKLYREGHRVILRVRDRGVGIAADQIHKIFGKFERGGKTFSVAGLGLGLYITREIIHAFKGSIHVESVEGSWTEFTVVLPGT